MVNLLFIESFSFACFHQGVTHRLEVVESPFLVRQCFGEPALQGFIL
jgi:hypothetical protein